MDLQDLSVAFLENAIATKDSKARMALRALARRSYYVWNKAFACFPFSRQGDNKMTAEVFKERADWVQKVVEDWKRGLLEDPRGHMKSWGATVSLPGWIGIQKPWVGEHPKYGQLDHPNEVLRAQKYIQQRPYMNGTDVRLAIIADSKERATKWVKPSRDSWTNNELIGYCFPELVWENINKLDYGKWHESEYHLPGRTNTALTDGFLRAGGISSKEQGGRCEGIVVDDLVGENSYKSATELSVRRDFIETIPRLLENGNYTDTAGGFMLLIGNRWCLDDVNSKVHDTLPHYKVWSRRVTRCFLHGAGNCGRRADDAGETNPDCRPTETPLWTAMYKDAAAIAALEADCGSYETFAAQYLNDPVAASLLDVRMIRACLVEIGVFQQPGVGSHRTWGVRCLDDDDYRINEFIPLSQLEHVISLDVASSTAAKAAKSCASWVAYDRPSRKLFWLDCRADRLAPSDAIDCFLECIKHAQQRIHDPYRLKVLCEKVAAQDYVKTALEARALQQKLKIPQIDMVPVPRNERKTDRNLRRIGEPLGQGLLYVARGLQQPRHEIRHHPQGTQDALDTFSQAAAVFAEMGGGSTDADRLAARRRAHKQRRLAAARSSRTGVGL